MMKITELRKIYSAQGVKGFGSANRAIFAIDFEHAHELALEEDAARVAPAPAPAPKKGSCNVCGKRRAAKNQNGQCEPCYNEGSWENEHNDNDHEGEAAGTDVTEFCWICHPELNEAKREPRAGRSRAGMVIIAKGTEIHKSETFRVAAEAAGWDVKILGSVNIAEDGEEQERYVAIATKGENQIELAWNGRAYDYPTSSASLKGKARKIRNLKEALRVL